MLRPLRGLLMAGALLVCAMTANAAERVYLYTAASLAPVMQQFAQQYSRQHPEVNIVPVLAASSVLARQILAGAPADLFISADLDWANRIARQQQLPAGRLTPGWRNHLVWIAPVSEKPSVHPIQWDQGTDLGATFTGRWCSADLNAVPLGRYTAQVLQQIGQLNALKPRLVQAADARAAVQLVARGECRRGIVYATDVRQERRVKVMSAIPDQLHQPIIYPVLLTGAAPRPQALQVYRALLQDQRWQVLFRQHGFEPVKR